MKPFYYLISILFLLVVAGCDKDRDGSLTLNFKGEYDQDPLVMFDEHLLGTLPLRFSHLSMYISDIELLKDGGSQHLSDIELIDLSYNDVTTATAGTSIQFDNIPADSYTGLRFSIGVPADLNEQLPADFPSTNPLSRTGYYWQAWQSYIFMKIEGSIETGLAGNFETPFSYHTGTDELYRTFEVTIPAFNISDGQNEEVNVHFDYNDMFEGVDIISNPQNHNPQDSVQINRIVNNLQSGINISL